MNVPASPVRPNLLPWLLVGTAAVCLVLLTDLNRLLGDVEIPGQRSYDAGVFTGLKLLFWDTKALSEAVTLWGRAPSYPSLLITWHSWTDLVFVITYTILIGLVLRQVGAEPPFAFWFSLAIGVIDCVETTAAYSVLVGRSFRTDLQWLLVAVQFFSLLKWVALCTALVTVTALLLLPPRNTDTANVRQAHKLVRQAREGEEPHPAIALMGLIVLVALFVALVALPAGGPLEQLPDVLRYLASPEGAASVRAWASVALLLFAGTIVAAGLASTDPKCTYPPVGRSLDSKPVVLTALATSTLLFLVAWQSGGRPGMVPFAPSMVVLAVCVAAWLARKARPKPGDGNSVQKRAEGQACPSVRSDKVKLWIGALAGLVIIAGGLGLIRAASPIIVLEGKDVETRWWIVAGMGALLALMGGYAAQRLILSKRWKSAVLAHGAVACVVIVELGSWETLLKDPSRGASWSTTGVVAIGFGLCALTIGSLKWLSRRHRPWSATEDLGLGRRTPWLAMLVVTWIVASALNKDGIYHDARVESGLALSTPRYADLKAAFKAWAGAQGDTTCSLATNASVPMVFVAAPGGGIRAAYWTAATLDMLFPAKGGCAARRLFAISGVSGGSVGAVTWLAARGHGKPGRAAVAGMSKDSALASAVAGLLTRDLVQPLTGFKTKWRDRAALLEDGWRASVPGRIYDSGNHPSKWSEIGDGIDGWVPVVVLNASSVVDGCRVLIANVGLLPASPGANCNAATLEDPAPGPVSASIDPLLHLYARDDADEDEAVCPSRTAGMRAVTAALLSARFPVVSPSGALLRCIPDTASSSAQEKGQPRAGVLQRLGRDLATIWDRVASALCPRCRTTREAGALPPSKGRRIVTYTVDGGYYENSGLFTLLQLWTAIEPEVRDHNASNPEHLIVPWVLVADNHYRSGADVPESRRPFELVVPLRAQGNNGLLGQTALEQAVASALGHRREHCRVDSVMKDSLPAGPSESTGCLVVLAPTRKPSVAAPLGWVLSQISRSDLDSQLGQRLGSSSDRVLSKLLRGLAPRQRDSLRTH